MALNPGALAMGLLGFVVLFGGLALALHRALEAGGYGDDEEAA